MFSEKQCCVATRYKPFIGTGMSILGFYNVARATVVKSYSQHSLSHETVSRCNLSSLGLLSLE
jgi:hypothetical protein